MAANTRERQQERVRCHFLMQCRADNTQPEMFKDEHLLYMRGLAGRQILNTKTLKGEFVLRERARETHLAYWCWAQIDKEQTCATRYRYMGRASRQWSA